MILMPPKKVCLVSLGCPKNLVDAEWMLGSLKQAGFELSLEPKDSEVLVVNTCSFIEGSKSESIDKLLELAEYKKSGKCELLVSTGCLSQRYGDVLASEMPEVDVILGTGEFDRLPQILATRLSTSTTTKTSPELQVSTRQILPDPDQPRILATPKHYAYVKLSEGCSHQCSFCIIPKIRGTLKSRPMDTLLQEVRSLVGQGVKEINFIAQDLNEYGRDLKDGTHLSALLKAVEEIPGEFWWRPLYMYPLLFNDELIATLAASKHWARYIDMPLQHINDRILQSMRRGSSGQYIRKLLTKLKTKIPDLTIRTTFIVGYPGESEAEFEELFEFVREFEFDRLGVFAYSQEENTHAATLGDQVPEDIKQKRLERLMELQQEISRRKQAQLVGRNCQVLVEGPSEENDWVLVGRLASQAPDIDGVTYLSETEATPGDFLPVVIESAADYDLVAVPTLHS